MNNENGVSMPFNGEIPTKVLHTTSNDYKVHLATGVTATGMFDRVEFSFFADRVRYVEESLVSDDQDHPELIRPSGMVITTPLREHVTAVSLNLEQIKALHGLIESLIKSSEEMSK